MGSNHHTPVEVDPAALEQARNVWHGFTVFTKFALIGVISVLVLMGIFLL